MHHRVIKLLALAISTCIAVRASAQNTPPPVAQTATQPPVAQIAPANKSDDCQSLMSSAQLKVLSDDEKASFAKCVSEHDFGGEVSHAVRNSVQDLTHGPGPNNDIVGRSGWVRSRLGF
jgi:hypothetical protein